MIWVPKSIQFAIQDSIFDSLIVRITVFSQTQNIAGNNSRKLHLCLYSWMLLCLGQRLHETSSQRQSSFSFFLIEDSTNFKVGTYMMYLNTNNYLTWLFLPSKESKRFSIHRISFIQIILKLTGP